MRPRGSRGHSRDGADSGALFLAGRVASRTSCAPYGQYRAAGARWAPAGYAPRMIRVLSAEEAVAEVVFDGATLMVGGFGLVGKPLTLVRALNASAFKDLTVISNNLGEPGKGLGETLRLGKVRRAIGSYFTTNPDVGAAVLG